MLPVVVAWSWVLSRVPPIFPVAYHLFHKWEEYDKPLWVVDLEWECFLLTGLVNIMLAYRSTECVILLFIIIAGNIDRHLLGVIINGSYWSCWGVLSWIIISIIFNLLPNLIRTNPWREMSFVLILCPFSLNWRQRMQLQCVFNLNEC